MSVKFAYLVELPLILNLIFFNTSTFKKTILNVKMERNPIQTPQLTVIVCSLNWTPYWKHIGEPIPRLPIIPDPGVNTK